jgi:CRISPR/Cas system-associated endoribonuclease Cas2
MSWKRYFTPVSADGNLSPISGSMGGGAHASRLNYSSYLPDVYAGHPNRLERYGQYDTMDSDSEVNAALDILAEFCTQPNDENGTPFQIFFKEQATNAEITIIKKYLQQWTKQNKFDIRIFKIVRNAFKYGDVFFVRDPETQSWMYIDPAKVDKIIVNESEGKTPEQYHIRDFNPNLETLATTAINPSNMQGGGSQFGGGYGTGQGGAGGSRGMVGSFPTTANSSRFSQNQNQYAIDARHVIHISMSEGLDNNFPFGNSLMESIFKVFKQKELLEDSIIIYRVQRAPERRVFYIDTGNMPSHLAMSFVERVKNEVNQRRIPSVTGGSQSVVDASYNPLSINEDYFFPQTAEGRGSKVEILQGGQNLGEIDDLRYFTNKLFRALRIPSSYLPTGSDDGGSNFNDGRVGTSYIQELRFNKYCERLQSLINAPFDDEFKLYLHNKGINVDSNIFDLKFNPPQNFAAYRQSEMDTARVNTFNTMVAVPMISKRFALKRFLGLTSEEIAENERQWKEENVDVDEKLSASAELRSMGITANAMSGDIGSLSDTSAPPPEEGGMPGEGDEGMGEPGGASPTPPAA